MATAYKPKVATSGLVLYLDAANRDSHPGSGTSWNDLSGNGSHATLYSSPGYSASNSGYLTFNGTNQYGAGTVPSVSNWSISMWYNASNITSAWVYYPFGIGGEAGLGFGGTIDSNTNGRWFFYDGVNAATVANGFSVASVVINRWYNLTVTKSGTSYSMYTNGSLSASGTGANISINSYNLGRRADGLWYVAGAIGGASIYNRALSASEVASNFSALRGRYGI